ncbi:hypothetical protein Pint_18989 [Pistacia integerrima]|uniref:Uncharacterized protein n=1 Tax=Pistacia integerrima TaxID=434235 RepID=A0ACC0YTC4_9ROSI|nr:hypothetical protein Pint_18989 [Pistacia integerrima]
MLDCLVADDEDVELLFESEAAKAQSFNIGKTFLRAVVLNCGHGKPHWSCMPDPHAAKIQEHCYDMQHHPVYNNRACHHSMLLARHLLAASCKLRCASFQ